MFQMKEMCERYQYGLLTCLQKRRKPIVYCLPAKQHVHHIQLDLKNIQEQNKNFFFVVGSKRINIRSSFILFLFLVFPNASNL